VKPLERKSGLIFLGLLLCAVAYVNGWLPSAPVAPVPGVPVSFAGSYALILDESGERTEALADATANPKNRARLDSLVGQGHWRYWDADAITGNAPSQLAELLKIGKPAAPCLVIARNNRAAIHRNIEADGALAEILEGL